MNSQNHRIPVLMYHEVVVDAENKSRIRRVHPNYLLPVQEFEQQMDYLFQNKYKSLLLDSLFKNECPNEKRVVITFDDGFIGNYTYAFPILKKYNLTATIFVIINQISTANYLNWKQLSELSGNGISIQSHTMTHRPLEELSDEEVFYELSMSKRVIEEKLCQPVRYLSLPHGSFHPHLFPIAKEIGYEGICSSHFGFINPGHREFTIGRIPVKRGYAIEKFQQIIREDPKILLKYKLVTTATNGLSRILGLKNYSRMYRFIFRIKPEC